jgi:DNA-binding MarR family transcriptional regulator
VAEVSEGGDVTITLTSAQVASVFREASDGRRLVALIAGVSSGENADRALLSLLDGSSYSRSTLRALLVLSVFAPDGSERELTDVAKQLGMAGGTIHRYLRTWVAVGLLEQSENSRRYRRPSAG